MTRLQPAPLRRLELAYADGGLPALRREYVALAEESRVYRTLWRLVDAFCPVSGFLTWSDRLNALIAESGYAAAAARAFDELGLPWEADFPSRSERTLRTGPLIAYGNHPSQITSLVVAAALGRSDLRFFSVEFFDKILPSSAPFILPLWDTHGRTWRDFVGSGLTHAAALSLLFRIERRGRKEDAREHNRQMLSAAAAHVRGGGSLLIFPMGGQTGWRDWFPGIGVLARDLAAAPPQHPAYLAPFCVENESNARLYSLLSTGGRRRSRQKRLCREPVRIRFGEPRPVPEAVAEPSLSPSALAAALQAHYRAVFPHAPRVS